ncbi:MAG: F0F1 ATP synthase subunit A [Chloroflexi bacterium]|nr:F0F1 ATP synthase subunit A [Chloroflexota bacterium]
MSARVRNVILIGALGLFLAQLGGLVLIKLGIAEDLLPKLLLRATKPAIEIKAETLWSIGFFDITNTLFTSWIVVIFLIVLAYLATRRLQIVPSGLQNGMEAIVEALYNLVLNTVGERHARRFLPVIATIFLYVVIANWFALLPVFSVIGKVEEVGAEEAEFHESAVVFEDVGVGLILPGAKELEFEVDEAVCAELEGEAHDSCLVEQREHAIAAERAEQGVGEDETVGVLAPYFRSVNTDLMSPLSLAIASAIFVEFWGISTLGFLAYGSRFFNVSRLRRGDPMGLIDFFVGILELIAEVARLISFSFRLFGNMLAGEILLLMMTFLVPLLLALPFYGLELFVGAIQAFVFAMLTLIFGALAVAGHGEEHTAEEGH